MLSCVADGSMVAFSWPKNISLVSHHTKHTQPNKSRKRKVNLHMMAFTALKIDGFCRQKKADETETFFDVAVGQEIFYFPVGNFHLKNFPISWELISP